MTMCVFAHRAGHAMLESAVTLSEHSTFVVGLSGSLHAPLPRGSGRLAYSMSALVQHVDALLEQRHALGPVERDIQLIDGLGPRGVRVEVGAEGGAR